MPSGLGAGLGLIIMPVGIIMMIRKDRGPLAPFLDVNATSPELARKPSSLKISRTFVLDGPIKRGVLVATGDGRYWVDLAAYKRSRRRIMIGVCVVAAALGVAGYFLWPD